MYEPSIRKQEHRLSSDFPLCILLAIVFALNNTLFFSASYVSIISFNTSEPVYFVLMGHKYETSKNSEAVARRCSIKKLFLDILQNSQENSLQLYEKAALAQMFSCEFCKISKDTFFVEHLRWLLLNIYKIDMAMLVFPDISVFEVVICRGYNHVIHVQSNSSFLITLYTSV